MTKPIPVQICDACQISLSSNAPDQFCLQPKHISEAVPLSRSRVGWHVAMFRDSSKKETKVVISALQINIETYLPRKI